MPENNIESIYALSPLQEGMLLHTIREPHGGVYHQQYTCELHGRFDAPAFKDAWQTVAQRHAALRTLYTWQRRERPLQLVRQQIHLPWVEEDWRGLCSTERKDRLESLFAADRRRGFQLDQAPLMRFALLRTGVCRA